MAPRTRPASVSTQAQHFRGLVLEKRPLRESDQLVVLLCEELGRIGCVARGASRSRKRFGAALAPFVLGEASLLPSRGGDLYTLQSFSVLADYAAISQNLDAMGQSAYATELVKELTVPGSGGEDLFPLLMGYYEQVVARGASPVLLRAFELHLLANLGLLPDFGRCVVTGKQVTPPLWFSPRLGGVIADLARGRAVDALPIDGETLQLMTWLSECPLHSVHELPAPGVAARKQARDVLHKVFEEHLRRPLKSLAFLAQMQRAKPR